MVGAAHLYQLVVDGRVIGPLARGVFYRLELVSGTHRVSLFESNVGAASQDVVIKDRANAFLEMAFWPAKEPFRLVTEEVGKKGVMECRLGKTL